MYLCASMLSVLVLFSDLLYLFLLLRGSYVLFLVDILVLVLLMG